MINREWQEVELLSSTELNDYGERKPHKAKRVTEMVIKPYSVTNVADVRYKETTHIGLTKEALLADETEVKSASATYKVLYSIPSGRLHQVLLMEI